jgi:putative endonuclease
MTETRRWAVYVLRCGDGTLYAGATSDVARRIRQHRAGRGARYTRSRLPVKLVYQEPARDRSSALRREAAIKRLTRAEKLRLIRCRTKRAIMAAAVQVRRTTAAPPAPSRGAPPSPT